MGNHRAAARMAPLILGDLRLTKESNGAAVVATIRPGDVEQKLRYSVCGCLPSTDCEPFLPIALLVALRLGIPLDVNAPVSPRLLRSLQTVQDIWHVWHGLARVAIRAESKPTVQAKGARGVGCFFSGGIDSFYTALKHCDEITHLIFVWGFDVPLSRTVLRAEIAGPIRRAARDMGKQLIEVETNVRQISDKYWTWEDAHGAALAGVALLLSSVLRKVYIPSSSTYALLQTLGSHPLLDPLWSTEHTEIVHDGCEASRFEKLKKVVNCQAAMQSLRVCWKNSEDTYNCCRCAKCLQAMALLRALGALQRVTTFDHSFDLRSMARECTYTKTRVPQKRFQPAMFSALEHVERFGNDPALAQALRDCVEWKYQRGVWKFLTLTTALRKRTAAMLHVLGERLWPHADPR
ncbi:MAG: hypothetical protein M3T49_09105 [Candidatus Eremiobacteraeota bacterium]|nr:hypothetical protein [Candidatus Eremiobacteraeota bacterium]